MRFAETAKMWVAAIGGTLTAVTTAWAAVEVTLSDNAIDVTEVGPIAAAIAVLVSTVAAVWRVENADPRKPGTNSHSG